MMINPSDARNYPKSIEEVTLGRLYRASTPPIGPMGAYNRLELINDDIILTITHGDNTNSEQVSKAFSLDDIAKNNKKLEVALEDKAIINYMKEYRKNFAGSLISEGILKTRSKWNEDEIFYNPENVKICDFAYLKFDLGTWNGEGNRWKLFLSISSVPLLSVAWNDLEGMAYLIEKLSENIETLAVEFALINPSEASKRTSTLSMSRKTDGYLFSDKERVAFKNFAEKRNAETTPSLEGMPLRYFDSYWTVDFKQNLDIASRILAFDYSFFVDPGATGDLYINEIKDEIGALGLAFIDIFRRPADGSRQNFPIPMDYVIGIVVKNEIFFEKNGRTFFDLALGRNRILYDDMALGGRIPSIDEIEGYTGYHLS